MTLVIACKMKHTFKHQRLKHAAAHRSFDGLVWLTGVGAFLSLCFLVSTVEPTQAGATQPKRNKETTRSTANCLQWAIGEHIGQYLRSTDSQGESQNGKLHCVLCAVWMSKKGAILKNHVLGKDKKHSDGSAVCLPGTHADEAEVPPTPARQEPEQPQHPPTIIVTVPQSQWTETWSSTQSSPTVKEKAKSSPFIWGVMLEKSCVYCVESLQVAGGALGRSRAGGFGAHAILDQ